MNSLLLCHATLLLCLFPNPVIKEGIREELGQSREIPLTERIHELHDRETRLLRQNKKESV